MIVGSRDRYESGSKNILIMRVDNNGKLMWEKELITTDNTFEEAYSISSDKKGGFFITSSVNDKIYKNNYSPRIIKIDSFGNTYWDRKLNANALEYHQFRGFSTQEGNYLVAGTSIYDEKSNLKSDSFITLIDGNGNLIWTNSYGTADNDDWGWSILEKSNREILMVGSTKSFNSSLFDIFLVRVGPDGE